MDSHITGSHRTTYDAVFQHPIARNLKWRDVWSMLSVMADTVEDHGEMLKVSRNGKTLVLHRPYRKDMGDIEDLMKIRRFLEESKADQEQPPPDGVHLMVVIDHREARIFRTEVQGTVPISIKPYDPSGSGRHLHYVENDTSGQRKPEQKSFYEAIAKAIHGAEMILLFGSGTGASSAMDQLTAELKKHHPEIAARIAGSFVVNEHHMSDNQLLAKAREFYATAALQTRTEKVECS